jgi:C4-dicarboxylate transporter DctQ subunit
MFSIISKIIGFINQSIAAIGIAAGVAVAFGNVVARYAFDASLTWASELSVILFLWSAFFGAAYCFKKDAHIAVTIVLDLMPSKIAKAMLVTSHTITIVFLLAVSYYGYHSLLLDIDLGETSVDLDIDMWIIHLVIPVSFFFGAYRVLERLVVIIKTPHSEVVKESEADMILHGMSGEIEKQKGLDNMVKEVEKKTGGML